MNDQAGDPRDAIDAAAGNRPKQQIIGPTDSLSDPTLAVDLARVEIDQAIATAHRFARKLDVVVQQITEMALYDEASSKACIYALPRAGKPIVGPSVSFANILATAWGNCHDGARWVRTDRQEKVVVCEGIFYDLQTNRRTVAPSTRRISTSKGFLYNDDMIAVTAMAGCSIARRNAILNGVPRPIWRPIYERALIVVRGTEATLPERRDELIKLFASFGVDPKRIAAALGVTKKDEVTLDHMVILQGMFEQLRNGDVTAEEMFDPRRMTGMGFDTVENPLGDEDEETGVAENRQTPGGAAPGGQAAGQQVDSHPATPAGPAPTTQIGASQKAAGASPAEAKPSAAPPAASAQQAAAGPANTAPAKAEPVPTTPKNEAEYIAFAKAWLKTETTGAAIEDRWRSERKLRNACGLTEETRAPLESEKKAKVAELGGAK